LDGFAWLVDGPPPDSISDGGHISGHVSAAHISVPMLSEIFICLPGTDLCLELISAWD
jgi:hypothetical protein